MDRLLMLLDLLGTIAFAVSGALVGIRRDMDIFGVNVLAIATATGGGLMRDLIIGDTPPVMFRNPFYVLIAVIAANMVFVIVRFHPHWPKRLAAFYDLLMFGFDTLGVAAFTVDGVMIGVANGYRDNLFLVVFLGVITGVGGGMLRDILANRMPDVLRKHVYALASIAGGIAAGLLVQRTGTEELGVIAGFLVVVLLRLLAAHYRWNLPKAE